MLYIIIKGRNTYIRFGLTFTSNQFLHNKSTIMCRRSEQTMKPIAYSANIIFFNV